MAVAADTYADFIHRKSHAGDNLGFEPLWMPDFLFGFQRVLVEWAIRKGRAAIFADCGMGKGPMSLVWAENVVRFTNGRSLILAPLAVSHQFVREGEKFGIEVKRSNSGKPAGRITVTNYEHLHKFDPADFDGVVCDESGILKNYSGATRNAIIAFLRTVRHIMLGTATPSPNDYMELGNSVEALRIMRRVEMLAQFFIHDGGDTQRWRLKGHAQSAFWRFVASWARAIRKPSDLGFADDQFVLPELRLREIIMPSKPLDGFLFPVTAITLDEQRQERRETVDARCGAVAEIANSTQDQFIAWCSLNVESERLAEYIDGAVEITGSQPDDQKEESIIAFCAGEIRAIVTKPGICGMGLNLQNCHRMSTFPSHSHEQFYQMVRRCLRFGQSSPFVDVSIVTTEAEAAVRESMIRKERQAEEMFAQIIAHMAQFYNHAPSTYAAAEPLEIPQWL